MTKRLYLSYGSNMHLEDMAKRCPTATVVGLSLLEDYELIFRGEGEKAFATVEPSKGDTVPVLLWDIKEADEVELDVYEEYPSLYRKEMVNVTFNEEELSVMVYIMNDGARYNIPTDVYYNKIVQGYEAASVDIKILENALEKTKQRMS